MRPLLVVAALAPLACVPDAPEGDLPLTGVEDLPDPPRDLRATTVNSTRIDLEWAAAAGTGEVDLYRVYRDGALTDSSRSTSFSDRDLEPYTSYEYSVSSVHEGREGEPSAPVSARTLDETPPSEPEDLEAEHASGSRVDLVWEPADDPESGVDHYRVYRGGDRIGTADTTFYRDENVRPFTIYSYAVTAVNGDGLEGEASDGVLVWTSQ